MSRNPDDEPTTADEFLNPASMLTPGLAGSLTMLITNALSAQFGFTASWTGLLVSFLCGTLVFVSSVGLVKKLIYYVLNSLIIFSVAAGTSGFAARATETIGWNFGISPAYAIESNPVQHDVSAHTASAAHDIENIDRVGRGSVVERWTVVQAQSEDKALQSVDGDGEAALDMPPAAFETELWEPTGEAAKAKMMSLEVNLEAAKEALAAAEMKAEIARQEAEAARQEAEAARQEAEAARLEAENARLAAEKAASESAQRQEVMKSVRQPTSGFFKSWF